MTIPPRRSANARTRRRERLPWPSGKPFRILSIDGGGIRGIFPASVLADLEGRFLEGESIVRRFDLVAGTSTGGIIALGLGAGMTAAELAELYITRGREVFPPEGSIKRSIGAALQMVRRRYDREALAAMLEASLGDKLLCESRARLCVPATEGVYGEVNVYKTPHHPEYRIDGAKRMLDVALATSAAPTYFEPLEDAGHVLIDGGVWANNPVMVAVVEALTSFDVAPERIQVLSLGCGDEPHVLTKRQRAGGGLWAWRELAFTMMRLQSQNALGQARLLVGPENLIRLDPGELEPAIRLDDWRQASGRLPKLARQAVADSTERVGPLLMQPALAWSVPGPLQAYEPNTTPEVANAG